MDTYQVMEDGGNGSEVLFEITGTLPAPRDYLWLDGIQGGGSFLVTRVQHVVYADTTGYLRSNPVVYVIRR